MLLENKFFILSFIILFAFIMLIFYAVSLMSSSKMKKIFSDSPFECGISMNNSSRYPYSMPFFFYLLIFLLFDMEVILIFPFIFYHFSVSFLLFYMAIMFLIVLSLFVEWFYGSLKWYCF